MRFPSSRAGDVQTAKDHSARSARSGRRSAARRALIAAKLGWMLDAMDFLLYVMAIGQLRAYFGFDDSIAGLLGTVTGMMATFAALNTQGGDIGSSTGAITGGVAEALIATMAGLGIAILGLLPFNYLNARLEEARHDIEDASNSLEIIIKKSETASAR